MAAHAVVPDRDALLGDLVRILAIASRSVRSQGELGRERLKRAEVEGALVAGIERATSRLRHAGDRIAREHPGHAAERCRQRLETCDWRRPVLASLASRRRDLGALQRHARSLSPQHVVERGFAVVRRVDGMVVRDPDQVAPGEVVEVTVARGLIAARVEAPGPHPGAGR